MTEKILTLAKDLHASVVESTRHDEGGGTVSGSIVPLSVVRNSRSYIERIVYQVNGCYDSGWYDACVVMIRRLIETLLIEAYENGGISEKIKSPSGDFLPLKEIVSAALNESSFNLARGVRRALPRLKTLGDKSAHSRRFNAHQRDLEQVASDVRDTVQELIYVSGLK